MKTRSPSYRPYRSRQSGYMLLQALGALMIFGAITVGYSRYTIAREAQALNEAVANHDIEVQTGVNKYIAENRINLLRGTPMTQFPAPLAPTLAQLSPSLPLAPGMVSYLPPGFDSPNALGYKFTIALSLLPAGCTVAVDCTDITGIMTSDVPLMDMANNKADGVRIAAIGQIIGADAGYSLEDCAAGAVFNSGEGNNCTPAVPATPWTGISNIRGSVPGIMAIRVGFGAHRYDSLDYLLPRDGSRPMLNNLPMNGFSIVDALDVNATGQVKARELLTPVAVTGSPCTDAGAIAGGKSPTGNDVVMICNTETMRWRQDGTSASVGDACSQYGMLATSKTTTEQLICKGSTFVKLTSLLPSTVEVSRLIVQDNQIVPIPVCDTGGSPFYHFSLSQIAVDVTTAPAKQGMYVSATPDGAGNYLIKLRLKDSSTGEVSGTGYGLFALMHLECNYP